MKFYSHCDHCGAREWEGVGIDVTVTESYEDPQEEWDADDEEYRFCSYSCLRAFFADTDEANQNQDQEQSA